MWVVIAVDLYRIYLRISNLKQLANEDNKYRAVFRAKF